MNAAAQTYDLLPSVTCIGGPLHLFEGPLLGQEETYILNAVAARRSQFRAGRNAARVALERLGKGAGTPIARGKHGEPLWPKGLQGSIAHTADWCVAAVSEEPGLFGLGVDVEAVGPLPPETVSQILRPEEIAQLDALPGGLPVWGRIVFGAKECVHKCINPATGLMLDFLEVRIVVGEHGRFEMQPVSDVALTASEAVRFEGRYTGDAAHLVTMLAAYRA